MTSDKNVISYDTFPAWYVLTASIHGVFKANRISVVGRVATGYGLDVPGIESRWG
jgi:hypothetical protein